MRTVGEGTVERRSMLALGAWGAGQLVLGSACGRPGEPPGGRPFLERRAAFRTKLRRAGPSPQPWTREAPPAGVQEIRYRSGGLDLMAWLHLPPGSPASKAPAVVYYHGGFAFGAEDFEDARPFAEAGYVVMCPTLRGENGNPGIHELFLSEVDDARAAVRWLAAHPAVQADRIHTFGHSAGGVVSALLSLDADVPIRHGGSAGGLYGPRLFDRMGDQVPFDLGDREERSMRVLVGNIRWMRRKHHAFVGAGDLLQETDAARREASEAGPRLLDVKVVEGDHHASLAPSVQGYLGILRGQG